jgi:hypothetical protein
VFKIIAISFIVVVTISEAQNPTKVICMSFLNCAPTQVSSKELVHETTLRYSPL